MNGRVPPACSKARQSQRGFTLIELMVSLLAGLIIAIGVVGLSKEATNTFHEEARSAAAEMGLRVAIERLRTDLQRAAFMSTGNIVADDALITATGSNFGGRIVHLRGLTTTANLNGGSFPGLRKLAGIHLLPSGSMGAVANLSTPNAVSPDAIEIGGNFGSGDSYAGTLLPLPPAGDNGCAGQAIQLSMSTVAAWRLATLGAAGVQAAFHPGTSALAQYMVRIADDSGKYQYAVTCPGAAATGFIAGTPPQIYINLDPASQIQNSAAGVPWNVGGLAAGFIYVNPVEIVHWDLRPANATTIPASYNYTGTNVLANGAGDNYVLTRQFVDANYLPDPATLEVVAEYAVDLKFAFSVDPTPLNQTNSPGAYSVGARLTYFGLDDPTNATWADDVSLQILTVPGPTPGPQRIRSVRVRLATRTAVPDRSQVPAPVPQQTSPLSTYMYRYCTLPGGCTTPGAINWSRVRTVVAETALPNQARLYY